MRKGDRLQLGRYRVIRSLGRGGQRQVALAEDRLDGRRVVLKRGTREAAEDARDLGVEISIAHTLGHPALIDVLDVFREAEFSDQVLVEPWSAGEDLEAADARLETEDLIAIIEMTAGGLAFLHACGLRHGDVKPANILVSLDDDERPRVAQLIDFGLSCAARRPEILGGTPTFLAPETHGLAAVTEAIDWWALGVSIDSLATFRDADPRSRATAALKDWRDACHLEDPERRLRAVHGLIRRRGLHPSLPRRLPLTPEQKERAAAIDRELLKADRGRVIDSAVVVGPAGSGRDALLEEIIWSRRLRNERVVFVRDENDVHQFEERLGLACGVPLEMIRARRRRDGEDSTSNPLAWLGAGQRTPRLTMAFGARAAECARGSKILEKLNRLIGQRRPSRDGRLTLIRAGTDPSKRSDLHFKTRALSPEEIANLLLALFPSLEADDQEAIRATAETLHDLAGGSYPYLGAILRAGQSSGALRFEEGRLIHEPRQLASVAAEAIAEVDEGNDPAAGPIAIEIINALETFAACGGYLDRGELSELSKQPLEALEEVISDSLQAGFLIAGGGEEQPLSLTPRGKRMLARRRTRPGSDAAPPRLNSDELAAHTETLAARYSAWISGLLPESAARRLENLAEDHATLFRAPALFDLYFRARLRAGEDEDVDRLLEDLGDLPGEEGLRRTEKRAILAARAGRLDKALSWIDSALESREISRAQKLNLSAQAAYFELQAGDAEAAATRIEAALKLRPPNAELARLLTMKGVAATRVGRHEEASAALERAIELWDEVGDAAGAAAARGNLGNLERHRGRFEAAGKHLDSAVATLETQGDPVQFAEALTNAGIASSDCGRHDEAVVRQDRAERAFRFLGDERRAAAARASRGLAELRAGRVATARKLLADAAARLVQQDDKATADSLKTTRASLALILGRRREFRKLIRDAPDSPAFRTLSDLASGKVVPGHVESLDDPFGIPDARSRECIPRMRGLLRKLHSDLEANEPDIDQLQRSWSDFSDGYRRMEQDMSARQATVFRATVINPELRRLEEKIDGCLRPGGARIDFAAEALRGIRSAKTLEEALGHVVRAATSLTPALRSFVVRRRPEQGFEFLAQSGALDEAPNEVSHHALKTAFESGEPVVIADAGQDDRLGFAPSVQRLGLRSVVCLPIRSQHRVFAVLYLDTPMAAGAFDEDVRRDLETLVDLSSVAIDLLVRSEMTSRQARKLREESESQSALLASRSRELSRAQSRLGTGHIIGKSPAIEGVNETIRKVAPTDLSVLVLGETGTGKELIAEALHAHSERRGAPFIAVNAAALPANLVESELFGHEKGAFTGAVKRELGLFRLARGGTVFLDEIGEIPLETQAKLLRALESGKVRPVGGAKEIRVDVRVIAATNRDIRHAPGFREDLFFRLAQIELTVPSLRERPDDIPLLMASFRERVGQPPLKFHGDALTALRRYPWPGNVRELRNLVERLGVIVDQGRTVTLGDLPAELVEQAEIGPPSLEATISGAVAYAMRWADGSKSRAAKALGISRTTLYKRLESLGPDFADRPEASEE